MYRRAIYDELEEHLTRKQVTVITGMRRVGKSTAAKYLMAQVNHENKVYLDFEKANNRFIFNQSSYTDIEINLQVEGIDFTKPSVIVLDEIQLVPNSTSVIKYLYDTYAVKFIVTGSSSFYLRNHFTESLAGRKTIFEMAPLSFAEFLQFHEIDSSRVSPFARKLYQPAFYDRYHALYEQYIRYGGFPEVVLTDTEKEKQRYLDDIVNAHIELDIRLLSDFSVSDDLFKLMRLLANRVGSKLDYSKISSLLGISRFKVKDYISLLQYTYFVRIVESYTSNPDRAIAHQPKLYISDSGLLNRLAQVSSGTLFENTIAVQLGQLGSLQYYQTGRSGSEIDFILNGNQALEVKETPTEQDLLALQYRAQLANVPTTSLIGRYIPASGFREFIWGGNLY
ncbi:ATP-binding protein [Spirosoma panaciterrae]|uniref:ATP-binding protein n=1 Tax=Spirosoma panaciterrae TaxID=496058 RepID=UPI00036EB0A7|nr:ATP-binding protein [Spirosoma panaciterrae]